MLIRGAFVKIKIRQSEASSFVFVCLQHSPSLNETTSNNMWLFHSSILTSLVIGANAFSRLWWCEANITIIQIVTDDTMVTTPFISISYPINALLSQPLSSARQKTLVTCFGVDHCCCCCYQYAFDINQVKNNNNEWCRSKNIPVQKRGATTVWILENTKDGQRKGVEMSSFNTPTKTARESRAERTRTVWSWGLQ